VSRVGESVFAIGHPGLGGGNEILTRTLSNGIISATGRKTDFSPGSFTQVTVPINPGNSGGPLFDDHGRVLAINTWGSRRNQSGMTLEGLNFCLEISALHELLADKSKSMDSGQIASILGTIKPSSPDNPLAGKVKTMTEAWTKRGYHYYNGSADKAQRLFRMKPGLNRAMMYAFNARNEYTVAIVSQGAPTIKLAVIDLASGSRTPLAADKDDDASPVVTFKVPRNGNYLVVVVNPTSVEALVQLAVFEK
jgi:hypothetical protein